MINNNDIEIKIARARDFAGRCLNDNFNGANKDDYFMFQISKFLLLKESMIKKDSDNNRIYFNIDENQEYLKAIKYIVDYVREHGTLISNNIDVVILPTNYTVSSKLKAYIRDFHKIRDSIAHGGYHIDSTRGSIILDNDNLKPGCQPNSNTYVIRGELPIEVLELFSYISVKPKDVYSEKEIDEFKTEVEIERKKYGYSGEKKYNIYNIVKEYNNINNNLFKYDTNKMNIDTYNYGSKIYNDYMYNMDKLKYNDNTYKYKNDNEEILKTSKEKEAILRELIKKLISNKKLSTEQKIQILRQLQKYGLIDSNIDLNNISIKTNKQPNRSYVDKLALVIAEISSIIGIKSNPNDTIKVSSVYNYMQLFLSFKHENINPMNKTNLSKLRISRINPQYIPGMKPDYEQKILAIKKYVKEKIIDDFVIKDKDGKIVGGKLYQYSTYPSSSFRKSINDLLKQHYERLQNYLATRNVDIITSIRNSLEHGNVHEENGNIKLHDQSNQNDSTTKNFECIGTPEDFYTIIKCIDLDQELNFTFDDFMIEIKEIIDKDMFDDFKEIVESIKKINAEALISTLKQVSTKK